MKNPTRSNPALITLTAKKTLNSLYNDYKSFVNTPDLPTPEIKFYDILKTRDGAKAYVQVPKSPVEKCVLNADITALTYNRERIRPLYFHEFTHIWDHFSLLNEISDCKIKNSLLFYYSEFHATIVEMQAATGQEKYSQINKLSLTSQIALDFQDSTIADYLQSSHDAIKKRISLTPQQYNGKELWDLKRFFSYYIGRKYFAHHYIVENSDQYFDTNVFTEIFGQEIIDISEILMENAPTLKKMTQIQILDFKIIKRLLK